MQEYDVEYLTPEGEIDTITVEGEDEHDAAEAARGELTEEHPSVATDEWEIRSVRLAVAAAAPSQGSPLRL